MYIYLYIYSCQVTYKPLAKVRLGLTLPKCFHYCGVMCELYSFYVVFLLLNCPPVPFLNSVLDSLFKCINCTLRVKYHFISCFQFCDILSKVVY